LLDFWSQKSVLDRVTIERHPVRNTKYFNHIHPKQEGAPGTYLDFLRTKQTVSLLVRELEFRKELERQRENDCSVIAPGDLVATVTQHLVAREQHTMMSGNVSFPARKRRAEGQAVKPPSDRIARKKVLAASEVKTRVDANSLQLAAPGSFTLANAPGTGGQRKSSGNDVARAHDSEHSTKVQSQKDNGSDAAVLLDLPAIVLDGPNGGRRPKAYGHVTEGAGNSLLVLGQSGAQRDTWRVDSTMYELHTPKLERREVSSSHCSPSAVKYPRTNTTRAVFCLCK